MQRVIRPVHCCQCSKESPAHACCHLAEVAAPQMLGKSSTHVGHNASIWQVTRCISQHASVQHVPHSTAKRPSTWSSSSSHPSLLTPPSSVNVVRCDVLFVVVLVLGDLLMSLSFFLNLVPFRKFLHTELWYNMGAQVSLQKR
jgi:hypothetical protein